MNPEWSYLVKVDEIPAAGRIWELEAGQQECAALARRFGILGVSHLTATVKVKPQSHSQAWRVTGTVRAQVVQACVVSLAPVKQKMAEDFDLSFSHQEPEQPADELDIDLSVEDPPDPLIDGQIDLGEVCAEHLALGLDLFPRAEGAEFHFETETYPEETPVQPSPFAVLAQIKDKKV